MENYWVQNSIGRKLQRSRLNRFKNSKIVNKLFRSRSPNEAYIAMHVKAGSRILDIACGAGQTALVKYGEVYGVDLEGFPVDECIKIGYKDAKIWKRDLAIPFKGKFDVVFCSNLNAHIDFQTLINILNTVVDILKNDGCILFVNEYEGSSFLEVQMRSNPFKYDLYKSNADHLFITSENEWVSEINKLEFLKLVDTTKLSTFLPSIHYYWWRSGNNLEISLFKKNIFYALDFIFSIFEFFVKESHGFYVGHKFVKRK